MEILILPLNVPPTEACHLTPLGIVSYTTLWKELDSLLSKLLSNVKINDKFTPPPNRQQKLHQKKKKWFKKIKTVKQGGINLGKVAFEVLEFTEVILMKAMM